MGALLANHAGIAPPPEALGYTDRAHERVVKILAPPDVLVAGVDNRDVLMIGNIRVGAAVTESNPDNPDER